CRRKVFHWIVVKIYKISQIQPTGLFGPVFYFSSTKYDKIVVTKFVMLSINITFRILEEIHK
ncbi:hypothetical protein ABTY57_25565, partial [Escherichia coli]|uniref:hypothetical protein n=1 Tax=Escherichia coli TaxID=562 RepID=UPI003316207B